MEAKERQDLIEVLNKKSFESAVKLAKVGGFKCKVMRQDAECFNKPGDELVITMVPGPEVKKKRKPSAYNLHISECMKSDAMKDLKMAKDRMRLCAKEWKAGGPELKAKFEAKLRALA